MSFAEHILAIPYVTSQSQATGLVAAIMRATGHILYLTGAFADPGYVLTDEEASRELHAAEAHLAHTIAVVSQAPVSTTCIERVSHFVLAVNDADAEWPDWDHDERGANLKALADRAASLGTFFDLELAGIRNSDPGRTL